MTMSAKGLHVALLGSVTLLFTACGGGTSSAEGGGSATLMNLIEVSNGFGQLVPHQIQELDSLGNPTQQIVSIRTQQDLIDNLTLGNQILPVPKFPETAILPSGADGNHFLMARFSQPIRMSTVLSSAPGSEATSGLTGAVSVVAIDPVTGTALPVIGRAFINGRTYAGPLDANNQLTLQTWVTKDPTTGILSHNPDIPESFGFPGTVPGANFDGSSLLVSPSCLVFVPDTNDDLSDGETFPTGFEIRMRITTALQAKNGKPLGDQVLAASTVGDDFLTPEIITTPAPLSQPLISPGNADVDVDPTTTIRMEFTEPVQPLTVGPLADAGPPNVSSAIKIQFGPEISRTDMPFTLRPISVYDLSVYEIIPAFQFPGSGPEFEQCGTFSTIDITLNAGQVADLAANPDQNNDLQPNLNLLQALTFFVTGEGPGLVNAPVAPDVFYVGRSGATPGISVLDLNGFGQSTGDPTFIEWTDGVPQPTHSNFPHNPNVRFQTGLRPPLSIGTCTIDGGSAGVFSLTRDSTLNDQIVRPPLVASVNDMMMGWSLDVTFNNAQFPFGCQAGGGDICTLDGLKVVAPAASGPNTLGPQQAGQFGNLNAGAPNIISWSPHPNPPALSFPPLCVAPFLLGDEPTTVDHTIVLPLKNNLLAPGDPFGNPLATPRVPPSGLLTAEQNAFFLGPSQGQVNLDNCNTFMIRQQIGHFLYVLDRQRAEITVLNSNRMTILDRIPVPDPTEMAMGTNLDFLAISNQGAHSVTFLDIDPTSSTFHKVIKVVLVGKAPRGLSWQTGNEDILVCNEGDSTLTIISAFSLEVRKTVSNQLNKPFDVVSFPRMAAHSFLRNVYFAYVINRNGKVAMFESGPNGVNGWGYDDVIGIPPFTFKQPKTIQADPIDLDAAAWIVHEGPLDPISFEPGGLGEGAISKLRIESAIAGQIFLGGSSLLQPGFRDLELGVPISIGEAESGLSGVPVDVAFDNQRNFGGLTNIFTTFSAGAPNPQNGKGLIRVPFPGPPVNATEPTFMVAAIPNANGGFGVVDVFEVGAAGVPRRDTNAFVDGIQSVQIPNVTVVMDYWRQ
jgi:hypothetical protein